MNNHSAHDVRTTDSKNQTPAFVPGLFEIEQLRGLELVNIRGDVRNAAFASTMQQSLGIALLPTPNALACGHTHDALWLAPDEWLLQSRQSPATNLAATLTTGFEDDFAAAIDVSSAFTVFELRGTCARRVLQSGCPLDLHPRVFTGQHCAQSHFFKAGVIVRAAGADSLHVFFRRSFTDYALEMLLRAWRSVRVL